MTKTLTQLQTWKRYLDKKSADQHQRMVKVIHDQEAALKIMNENADEVTSFYSELKEFHMNMKADTKVYFDNDIGYLVAGEEREDIF